MTVRILEGDAREVLRELPEASVQCVVTSPPYWGLRDYGVAGQIGLEATPEEYVAELVRVFREVRRVLRPDGVLWLNLGDCYATGAGRSGEPGGGEQGARWRGEVGRVRDDKRGYRGERLANGRADQEAVCRKKTRGVGSKTRATRDGTHAGKHTAMAAMGPMTQPNRMPIPGLKPKDLVGVPWRVAFALQADGWWLRADVVWSKPSPMPESVSDRPTRSHEYVFLLARSERYFYDAAAIAEPLLHPDDAGPDDASRAFTRRRKVVANPRQAGAVLELPAPTTRNARSVWTIASQPYPEAHFATFPERLAARCVMAGTPEAGACGRCGAPRVRETETRYVNPDNRASNGPRSVERRGESPGFERRLERVVETKGYRATCGCGAPAVPAVVLDPFGGSGTVGRVCEDLGRDSVLVELSPAYVELARRRTAQAGLFSGRGR